jgi:PQQ enzyme repeat domain protein
LGGAAINGEVKYENLNANVPRKEQSTRIDKPSDTYFYEPVCLRDEVLYFGTAGKGRDLYGVDAKSGEVVFKFETGWSEYFCGMRVKFCLQTAK